MSLLPQGYQFCKLHMRYLNTLDDIEKSISVCLFGAGDYGICLFNLLQEKRPDISIECFIDTFKLTPTCGKPTIKPCKLKNVKVDLIIITSHYFLRQISLSLDDLNIRNYVALNPIFNSRQTTCDLSPTSTETFRREDVLYAFYDFSICPPGFDYLFFLYLAEIERINVGCRNLHPVLVPEVADMLVPNCSEFCLPGMGSRPMPDDRRNWWKKNIIYPSNWLLESCDQLTICNSREEAQGIIGIFAKHIFPTGYKTTHPISAYTHAQLISAVKENSALPSFSSSPFSLNYIEYWIKDHYLNPQKLVTLTLRESIGESKNSNIKEWVKLADELRVLKFTPILIRDTSASLSADTRVFKDHIIFREAPWNLEIRMALYESCYLNLFTGNGPAWLCLMNRKSACLMFSKTGEGDVSFKNQMRSAGLSENEAYPSFGDNKKISFSDDTFEFMLEEFLSLHKQLQSNCKRE